MYFSAVAASGFSLNVLTGLTASARLRDNVAVLFAGVGRLNAHQGEVCVPLPGQLGQRFQRGKIVIVDIGVYRADDDSLIKADTLDVVQVAVASAMAGKVSRRHGSTQTPTELPSWL